MYLSLDSSTLVMYLHFNIHEYLQDIRELQMTDNPSYGDADDRTAKTAGNNYGDKSRSKWIWWVLIKTLQAWYK